MIMLSQHKRKDFFRLEELTQAVDSFLIGDKECEIRKISSINKAQVGSIAFLTDERFVKHLTECEASCVVMNEQNREKFSGNIIVVNNPRLAQAKLSKMFYNKETSFISGIHPSVVIGKNCKIATNVVICAGVVIKDNVKIKENSIIDSGSVIGNNSIIGENCHLKPRVVLMDNTKIGNSVIIHSGAIIGADGFGFTMNQGKWHKIMQLGGVNIGNDVEIGANTCIDCGAIEDTIIEDGVKLDNLIQIAHNVVIGQNSIMAGSSAIAGSTVIGKNCMIGGASSISDHLNIVDGVIISACAQITKSINKPGIYSSVVGFMEHKLWLKNLFYLRRLYKFMKKIKIH